MKKEIVDVLYRPSIFGCRSSIEIELFLNGMFYAELNNPLVSTFEYNINTNFKAYVREKLKFNFGSTWGRFIYGEAKNSTLSLDQTKIYLEEYAINIPDDLMDRKLVDNFDSLPFTEVNLLIPFFKKHYSSLNISNIHELWTFLSGFDHKKRLLTDDQKEFHRSIISYESGFKKYLSKVLHFSDRYTLPLMIECNSNTEEAGLKLFFEIFEEWKQKGQNQKVDITVN